MKCNKCKYLCYPEYESSYTSCEVFGDYVPEKYERKDGEGCKCTDRQLRKILQQNLEAWIKDREAFVKWFLEHEESEVRNEQNKVND